MKQKILLGVLVTSIFLTFFSVNVRASEEESTTSTLTLIDDAEQETNEIQTIYNSYIITQYDGVGKYIVLANIHSKYIDGSTIKTAGSFGFEFTCLCVGAYDTLEEAKQGVINGGLTEKEYYRSYDMTGNYYYHILFSSHDIYINYGKELVFQRTPLTTSTQTTLTVGRMNSQQIVTATTKEMVYLVPCLIVSLVGYLAFRKGLGMLFRVLARA